MFDQFEVPRHRGAGANENSAPLNLPTINIRLAFETALGACRVAQGDSAWADALRQLESIKPAVASIALKTPLKALDFYRWLVVAALEVGVHPIVISSMADATKFSQTLSSSHDLKPKQIRHISAFEAELYSKLALYLLKKNDWADARRAAGCAELRVGHFKKHNPYLAGQVLVSAARVYTVNRVKPKTVISNLEEALTLFSKVRDRASDLLSPVAVELGQRCLSQFNVEKAEKSFRRASFFEPPAGCSAETIASMHRADRGLIQISLLRGNYSLAAKQAEHLLSIVELAEGNREEVKLFAQTLQALTELLSLNVESELFELKRKFYFGSICGDSPRNQKLVTQYLGEVVNLFARFENPQAETIRKVAASI